VTLRPVPSAAELRAALRRERWDLALWNVAADGLSAREALAILRATAPGLPFVILHDETTEHSAAALIAEGAHDYVSTVDLRRLPHAAAHELRHAAEYAGGEAMGFAGVTAERRPVQVLTASEERFRSLHDALAGGVFVVGPDGGVIDCNPAAERLLGIRSGASLATAGDGWEWTGEDGLPLAAEAHPTLVALATGEAQRNATMRVHRPDGALSWLQLDAVPIQRPDGRAAEVVTSVVEVTAHKQAEQMVLFLAEVSAVLSASLDFTAALNTLARRCVPFLAHWCAVDVVDANGAIRRVAVAADTPDRQRAAEALLERSPSDQVARAVVTRVLASGVPELYAGAEAVERLHREIAPGQDQRTLLRSLGLTSRARRGTGAPRGDRRRQRAPPRRAGQAPGGAARPRRTAAGGARGRAAARGLRSA
jgi:PAS domain-containing protein